MAVPFIWALSGALISMGVNKATGKEVGSLPAQEENLCTTADALATACMVLGPEKALALIERLPGIEAYFIVSAQDGSYEVQYTPGVKPWLLDSH